MDVTMETYWQVQEKITIQGESFDRPAVECRGYWCTVRSPFEGDRTYSIEDERSARELFDRLHAKGCLVRLVKVTTTREVIARTIAEVIGKFTPPDPPAGR